MYYRICPDCGASLDPEEICNCEENAPADVEDQQEHEVEQ